MTITPDNYLDFGNLLIYELLGSVFLAWVIGAIMITYYGVQRRIPANVIVGLNFAWLFMLISYVYNALWLMLMVTIIGGLVYFQYSKLFKR